MWYSFFLTSEQTEFLDLFPVDFARFHRIDAGRVDAAVPENVGEPDDVLPEIVEGAREEVPEIVRKHFLFADARRLTEFFHVRPDIGPIQRLAAPRDEDGTGRQPFAAAIVV